MRRSAVAVLLLALLALVACSPDRDALLEASEAALEDDARFATPRTSGQTYADVAATLLEATKRCAASRGDQDPRCAARAAGAAFFQVLSDEVVDCDRAAIERSRRAARTAVQTIDDADRAGGDQPPPEPPALPRC
jgi:hypothetical protein